MAEQNSPNSRFLSNIIQLFKNYSLFEIVFIGVLSVAIGVSYWGWTFVYEITKPFLKLVGLNYLTSGFWLFIGIFIPLIIRRPGAAILASVIAAGVEGFITHWGIVALLWGLIQGLGAELVFFSTSYKKWTTPVLIMAGISSASLSYLLDFFYYDYQSLKSTLILTQYLSYIISAVVFAVLLSLIIIKRLTKIQILNRFLIAKENRA